jgi:protein TonB
MAKPVEPTEAAAAPTETVSVAETEDLVSAEVLMAKADRLHPVEAAIPEITSEAAIAVVETAKPSPSQSDPLAQLRTASISAFTPETPAQKLPAALVKAAEATAPVQTANLDPVAEEVEETTEATPVPLPPIKRKPVEAVEPAKPQKQAVEQPKKKTEQPKAQQASKQANLGNGGAAQSDTTASSKSGGGQGKKDDGGSAAASKYEGQVQSKVSRAVRKVETGRGGRGILRFALGAGGNVLSVSVLKSSGDPSIDAAAVAAVNRGAPYPPIPPATGKTSWSFGLPFGDK